MQTSNSRNGRTFDGLFRALSRAVRDNAGNTLVIVGAALIPITAMIGSGVDISRAYMAQSRLQSACDAASLAARRVMKNDNPNDTVIATGKQFFNFNFPQGLYQTSAFQPVVTKPATGLIRVAAETRIPTTVMKIFGFQDLPLSVSCEASLNFVNTDVVLVLDVTGSMAESVGGTVKIQALRDAVMALYDELAPIQTQLESQSLRLRYGVVPYSSTVNVGRLLYAKNPAYIRSSTPYQSRVANYADPQYALVRSDAPVKNTETYSSTLSSSNCNKYAANRNYPSNDGPGPFALSGSKASGTETVRTYEFKDWGGTGTKTGNTRTCRRDRIDTTNHYAIANYGFNGFTYQQATLDTSSFKAPGGKITLAKSNSPSGTSATSKGYNMQELAAQITGNSKTDYTWNGCIEERTTTIAITPSSDFNIPSGAWDLDINTIPDNEETRWPPMLKEAVYYRKAGSTSASSGSAISSAACPYEARTLQTWGRGALLSYVNALPTGGGTYLDVGMIWGARLISTSGVFADGCNEYNGMPCNRHIIFMTDGAQTAYCASYTAYGVERNDKRILGADNCVDSDYDENDVPEDAVTAALLARHQQRFNMICNATKNMNVSVWVVAFSTSLTANLTSCASNPSQAKTSSNRDELIAQFREIGNQIGALRLTK